MSDRNAASTSTRTTSCRSGYPYHSCLDSTAPALQPDSLASTRRSTDGGWADSRVIASSDASDSFNTGDIYATLGQPTALCLDAGCVRRWIMRDACWLHGADPEAIVGRSPADWRG